MTTWSIPPSKLNDARSRGGEAIDNGITYQQDYAVLQLVNMLIGNEQLVRVRYEGVEDVDLLFDTGAEVYVQLKNEPDTHYSILALRSIFQWFARVLNKIPEGTNLRLKLVARSNTRDDAVERLFNGTPTNRDITAVSDVFIHKTETIHPPAELKELNASQRERLAQRLLDCLVLEFGRNDTHDGVSLFEHAARTNLAKHGITDTKLQEHAIAKLKAALHARAEFTADDVKRLVAPFLCDNVIKKFEHKVERLSESFMPDPAAQDRIQEFYSGSPVNWDIIRANADVRRDCEAKIVEDIVRNQNKLRLVCLVGEPGSGKSTMLRRIAVQISTSHSIPVLYLRSKGDDSVWRHLEDFYRETKQSFVLMVDELVRASSFPDCINEIDPSVPMTVLTAAWPGELKRRKLTVPVIIVEIPWATQSEISRALSQMGKRLEDLSTEHQRYLDSPMPFLVLMILLSTGMGIRDYYENVLERLQDKDPILHRAYEYVCFAFQYDVAFPQSLLERLDSNGAFHQLLDRNAANVVVFAADVPGQIRAAHSLIAREVCRIFGRAPEKVIDEIAVAIDLSKVDGRLFLAHLLRAFASRTGTVSPFLPTTTIKIEECQERAGISELSIWYSYYESLNMLESAQSVVVQALTREPQTARDWGNLLVMGPDDLAGLVLRMRKWLQVHSNERAAFRAYLRLAASHDSDSLRAMLELFWQTVNNDDLGDLRAGLEGIHQIYISDGKRLREENLAFTRKALSRLEEMIKAKPTIADECKAIRHTLYLLPDPDLRRRLCMCVLTASTIPAVIGQVAHILAVDSGADPTEILYERIVQQKAIEGVIAFARALSGEQHIPVLRKIFAVAKESTEANTLSELRQHIASELLKAGQYHEVIELMEPITASMHSKKLHGIIANAYVELALRARKAKRVDEAKRFTAAANRHLAALAKHGAQDRELWRIENRTNKLNQ